MHTSTNLPSRTWWTAEKLLSRRGVDGRRQVEREEDAILISSLTTNGLHAPCLDFDFKCQEYREGSRTWLMLNVDGEAQFNAFKSNAWETTLRLLTECGLGAAELGNIAYPYSGYGELIEISAPFRIIPSSNPPHCHVYIDKEIAWEQYEPLLIAMREWNILQRGFVNNSIKRKMTMLLKPGLKKEALAARGIIFEGSAGPEESENAQETETVNF